MCSAFFAVKCSVCKSVSDTYDPYLDVALEIRVCQNYSIATTDFLKVLDLEDNTT